MEPDQGRVAADPFGTTAAHQGAGTGRVTRGERTVVGSAYGDTPKALGRERIIGEGVARHGHGRPRGIGVAVSRRASATLRR